jgi:hypothetical protein
MAGANPQMLVRIAANLEELKRNLAEGRSQIETTTTAMQKLAASFRGDKLIQQAQNVVAAVNEVGGAAKLSGQEQDRVNSIITRALEKYQALGREAPPGMRELAEATRRVKETTEQMPAKVNDWRSSLGGLAGAFGVTFSVGAVVAFGRELLSTADKITLLADKTGMTTEQVQRLQYVESQTSVSVDGMVGAIQNLQQRLGDGDAGAVGAMKALGINMDAFLSLNPYDQFMQVAAAVGGIEDPTVHASIAADIFGKSWKEIGPVLTKTLKGIANDAPVMGDNTVAALDRAGDALAKFHIAVKVWAAEAYNFFGRVMDMQVAAIYRLVGGLYDATARVVELAAKVPGASKVLGDLTDNVASLRQTALWYSDTAKAMAFQNGAVADQTKKLTPEAIAAGIALRDQVEAYKAAATAAKTHTGATEAHTAATRALKNEIIPAIHYMEGWEGAISSLWQKVKLTIPTLEDLPRPIALTSQALDEIGIKTTVFKELPGQVKAAAASIKDNLLGVLLQVPQTIANAFTGGGGAAGAIKSIASGVGAAVGSAAGMAIGGPLGGAIGSAIGSLAGPLVGKIGSLLGIGATEYEKRMKAAAQETKNLQQQLVSSHGSMAQLIVDADLVGINIKEAFNWKDPEAFKKVVDDVNSKTELLNSAMKEYGFTWEDLGEKARGAKLSQLFDDLFAKTDVLRTAGIDYHTILERQAGDYSKLVQSAIRTGTEIPAAMMPVLQDLADMGQLVDENGVAFTDLSKVQWAKTLTQGFDQVTAAIYELTDALTKGVGGALDDLGHRVVRVPIKFDVDQPDGSSGDGGSSHAYGGGLVVRDGVKRFAYGGLVPSGTDTVPAMLTPGEIVLNAAQQGTLAEALAAATRSRDGNVEVHVYIGQHELDSRIVTVARKEAARGGLKPRQAAGRSY